MSTKYGIQLINNKYLRVPFVAFKVYKTKTVSTRIGTQNHNEKVTKNLMAYWIKLVSTKIGLHGSQLARTLKKIYGQKNTIVISGTFLKHSESKNLLGVSSYISRIPI